MYRTAALGDARPPYRRMDDTAAALGPVRPRSSASPNRLRWDPLPMPSKPTDFVDGLATLAGSGDPASQSGIAVHIYRANRSMSDRVFYNADGELMFVPQQGTIALATELGRARSRAGRDRRRAARHEIQGRQSDGPVRGYLCENYGAPSACPSSGRSARRGWRRSATSSRRWRRSRTAAATTELVAKFLGGLWATDAQALAARRGRLARQLRRRTSTTSRASW